MLPPEKIELLKELWTKGVRVSEIGRILGVNPKTIYIYVRIHGLEPRRRSNRAKIGVQEILLIREMRARGARIREIAEKLRVSPRTVAAYIDAMGLTTRRTRRCPEIDAKTLLDMATEGLRDREIAERLGVSLSCVSKYKKLYGVRKRDILKRRREDLLRRVAEEIERIIEERGFVTSRELRRRKILLTKSLVDKILSIKPEIRWFKMRYTSTHRFTVFTPRLGGVIFLYKDTARLVSFLINNMREKSVPTRVVRYLMRLNKAPTDLIEHLVKTLKTESSRGRTVGAGERIL